MKHLEAAFTGKNNLWRYIVMLAAVLIASNTVGSVPLLIAWAKAAATNPEVTGKLSANPTDFSVLGLNPYLELFTLLFPFLAALAAFILLVKPLNQRTFLATINGNRKIRWSHFFISALVWAVLSAIYLFVYLKIDPENFVLNNKTISLLFISIVAIILIPFQATLEEVVFRGYLMQGFALIVRNRFFPLIMTSVLFGLLHSFNPEIEEFGFLTMMPQYVLFGLIFGIITIFDDGIEASMGAHAANNIFLVIFVTNKASALQSPAMFEQLKVQPWTEFTGLLISGIIFIIVLKIIFKWNDTGLIFRKIEKPVAEVSSGIL
jgi:membrane protease YdiL (CAAX protease family)